MNPSKESEIQVGEEFLQIDYCSNFHTSHFSVKSFGFFQVSDLMSLIIMLFKQSDTALSLQQENRLKQVGVTRNAGSYMGKLKMNEGREILTRWETLL